MRGLRPGSLDLTGRQRCQWGQVLLRLEAQGLLLASLPEGLPALPPGSPPAAWIEAADLQGQVLPWLLRLLTLQPQDATLLTLGRDLGLCVDSRERLQCSPGWRHWTGLESAVQGLARWSGGGPAQTAPSRTQVLEGWAQRLLCLWRAAEDGAEARAQALVLDLGGGQLLPLDAGSAGTGREPMPSPSWLLGALPRHALDRPPRDEAGFEPWPPGGPPLLRWDAGPLQSPPQSPLQLQPAPLPGPALLWSRRAASARLSPANLGHPRPGPVLLMGADPGRPPQLCLALLQGKAGLWRHDARPIAMGGGALCLDLQGRLLGWLRPLNEEDGRVLALLWS